MRASAILLSVNLALFLLVAGFFAVYADHGSRSVWETQAWSQKEQEQVMRTTEYLDNRIGADALSFYTANEASHLRDVRTLFGWLRGIFAVLALVLIGSGIFAWRRRKPGIRKKKERRVKKEEARAAFRQVLFWGGMGGLGLVAILALLSIDFTWFWSGPFHEILFPQGNWMFPASSVLITLFPETFFRQFATNVLAAAAAFSAVATVAGFSLRSG